MADNGVLQGKGIPPHRPLEEDLKLTDQAMSYDGSANKRSRVTVPAHPAVSGKDAPTATEEGSDAAWPVRANGAPDFEQMSSAQRRHYDAHRLKRIYG